MRGKVPSHYVPSIAKNLHVLCQSESSRTKNKRQLAVFRRFFGFKYTGQAYQSGVRCAGRHACTVPFRRAYKGTGI